MSFISIYITNKDEAAAQSIADHLIERKVVACANLFPIKSAYWWKGEIAKEEEWVALVKTVPEKWGHVCEIVENIHPYETPCIMKTEVEANLAYENWIRESVE